MASQPCTADPSAIKTNNFHTQERRAARVRFPNIRHHHTKLNNKAPGGGAQVEWHTDWGFYPHTNDDILEVGVAIDPMTIENGSLMVVPGSHKGPAYDHHENGVLSLIHI